MKLGKEIRDQAFASPDVTMEMRDQEKYGNDRFAYPFQLQR
jgi:hypothetical protein